MEERNLRIYYTYARNREVPCLRLQGKWLEELGFLIGKRILVQCQQDSMLIKIIEEKKNKVNSEKGKDKKR